MHQPEPFRFVQFSKAFLTWPLIAIGFLLALLNVMAPTVFTEEVMGTIWLPFAVFIILAICEDFPIAQTVVIFLIVGLVILSLWVVALTFNVPILTWILDFLRLRDFAVSRDFLIGFSSVFTLILLCYWVDILIRRRWIVIQGMLFRKVWGHRADEIVITPPWAVTYEVPDIMDGAILALLGWKGLGGTLVIKRENERKRIPGVLNAKDLAERIQPFQAVPTEEQDRTSAAGLTRRPQETAADTHH